MLSYLTEQFSSVCARAMESFGTHHGRLRCHLYRGARDSALCSGHAGLADVRQLAPVRRCRGARELPRQCRTVLHASCVWWYTRRSCERCPSCRLGRTSCRLLLWPSARDARAQPMRLVVHMSRRLLECCSVMSWTRQPQQALHMSAAGLSLNPRVKIRLSARAPRWVQPRALICPSCGFLEEKGGPAARSAPPVGLVDSLTIEPTCAASGADRCRLGDLLPLGRLKRPHPGRDALRRLPAARRVVGRRSQTVAQTHARLRVSAACPLHPHSLVEAV